MGNCNSHIKHTKVPVNKTANIKPIVEEVKPVVEEIKLIPEVINIPHPPNEEKLIAEQQSKKASPRNIIKNNPRNSIRNSPRLGTNSKIASPRINNNVYKPLIFCDECSSEKPNKIKLECGHSICVKCYTKLNLSTRVCPIDNKLLINENRDIKQDKINNNILDENLNKNQESEDIQDNQIFYPNELVLKCPQKHQKPELRWIINKKHCYNHRFKTQCLGCYEHEFYVCLQKCVYNRFRKGKCFENHDLIWYQNELQCCKCNELNYGFTCEFCEGFYICVNCSHYDFNYELCPNFHKLLPLYDKECTKCLNVGEGFGCEECKYFICNYKGCKITPETPVADEAIKTENHINIALEDLIKYKKDKNKSSILKAFTTNANSNDVKDCINEINEDENKIEEENLEDQNKNKTAINEFYNVNIDKEFDNFFKKKCAEIKLDVAEFNNRENYEKAEFSHIKEISIDPGFDENLNNSHIKSKNEQISIVSKGIVKHQELTPLDQKLIHDMLTDPANYQDNDEISNYEDPALNISVVSVVSNHFNQLKTESHESLRNTERVLDENIHKRSNSEHFKKAKEILNESIQKNKGKLNVRKSEAIDTPKLGVLKSPKRTFANFNVTRNVSPNNIRNSHKDNISKSNEELITEKGDTSFFKNVSAIHKENVDFDIAEEKSINYINDPENNRIKNDEKRKKSFVQENSVDNKENNKPNDTNKILSLLNEGKKNGFVITYSDFDVHSLEKIYNKGIELYVQKNYLNAEKYYKKVLSINSDFKFVHNSLGLALKKQNKNQEAELSFRKAIEIDPLYKEAYINLGVLLKKQKKYDDAENCYKNILEIDNNYKEAYFNLGNTMDEQGKIDDAIKCYLKAVKIEPKYIRALFNLGVAYSSKKKYDEAFKYYRNVIEIDKNFKDAYNNIGIIFFTQRKYKKAVSNYKLALSVDPLFKEAYNNLGNALLKQGKLEEAAENFTKATQIDPFYKHAEENLNQINIKMKRNKGL